MSRDATPGYDALAKKDPVIALLKTGMSPI